jgi:DNA-binding transcriptional LysR family regulator
VRLASFATAPTARGRWRGANAAPCRSGSGVRPFIALVRSFRQAVPDVQISFHAMAVLSQIEALRDGEIDLGIVRLPVHDEMIETQFVHSEPLVLALPVDHPVLAVDTPVAIGDLAGSRFVTYQPRRGFNYHADLFALCRLAGFEPNVAHEAGTTEAIIGIVACGEGVAIVPASAERLRMSGVAFRPLDVTDVPARLGTVEFALAWHRERLTAAAAEFIQRAQHV